MTAASGGSQRRRNQAPGLERERLWWHEGAVVAGIDEVGRGSWAGPVTYAAMILPTDRRMYKLRDSKVLRPSQREVLAARLKTFALGIGIGHADSAEIDAVGMSEAIRRAARRAMDALPIRPDVCLVDGNWDFLSNYGTQNECIVRGDSVSASIAAASIVAKVTRDAMMVKASDLHPEYAFWSNKGYPSPPHRTALAEHGPCPMHRHSWAPIAGLRHMQLMVSS